MRAARAFNRRLRARLGDVRYRLLCRGAPGRAHDMCNASILALDAAEEATGEEPDLRDLSNLWFLDRLQDLAEDLRARTARGR